MRPDSMPPGATDVHTPVRAVRSSPRPGKLLSVLNRTVAKPQQQLLQPLICSQSFDMMSELRTSKLRRQIRITTEHRRDARQSLFHLCYVINPSQDSGN